MGTAMAIPQTVTYKCKGILEQTVGRLGRWIPEWRMNLLLFKLRSILPIPHQRHKYIIYAFHALPIRFRLIVQAPFLTGKGYTHHHTVALVTGVIIIKYHLKLSIASNCLSNLLGINALQLLTGGRKWGQSLQPTRSVHYMGSNFKGYMTTLNYLLILAVG